MSSVRKKAKSKQLPKLKSGPYAGHRFSEVQVRFGLKHGMTGDQLEEHLENIRAQNAAIERNPDVLKEEQVAATAKYKNAVPQSWVPLGSAAEAHGKRNP